MNVQDLLSKLVSIGSVNPGAGAVAAAEPFGEGRLVTYLADLLSGWGASTQVIETSPTRFNLLARFAGANRNRHVLLEAHGDTVAVADMAIPPFEPSVRDGRLYGRGSCDTKAPMAAMLSAVRRLLDQGKLPCDVTFATTCDEEAGSSGAYHLAGGGFKADFAVVGEPTSMNIVNVTKGAVRFRLATKGLAAHSSQPHKGINAVTKMTRIVDGIETRLAPRLAAKRHPLLGAGTLTVGTISGGTQVNVVPANCTIEIDRRTLPGETDRQVQEELMSVIRPLQQADPQMAVTVERTQGYPAFEQPQGSPICKAVAAAAGTVLGAVSFAGVHWTSNAGIFANVGIPSILIGPGDIAQAHTKDEYVELAQLQKAVPLYAQIIRELASMNN